jgi:16S rRNA (cytidine1402-2'-O)-methyltransferase
MVNNAKLRQYFGEFFGANGQRVFPREISKLHEETVRGTLAELVEYFGKKEARGEFVVVVGGGGCRCIAFPRTL